MKLTTKALHDRLITLAILTCGHEGEAGRKLGKALEDLAASVVLDGVEDPATALALEETRRELADLYQNLDAHEAGPIAVAGNARAVETLAPDLARILNVAWYQSENDTIRRAHKLADDLVAAARGGFAEQDHTTVGMPIRPEPYTYNVRSFSPDGIRTYHATGVSYLKAVGAASVALAGPARGRAVHVVNGQTGLSTDILGGAGPVVGRGEEIEGEAGSLSDLDTSQEKPGLLPCGCPAPECLGHVAKDKS